MSIAPNRMLAHYRLIEKIGEGGMGVVWKALDTTLDRQVAIKILPGEFFGDAERLARFEREARLLAALNHPNVAAIYGIHEADGVRFLAMELVDGEDLAARLARGALPQPRALSLALEIARGLEAAHERGVVHRDLKPGNVKLTAQGAVKVLDFGLAKAFAPDSDESGAPSMSPTITSAGTVAGMILGTAAYMSPEQAKGREVDRRADIWSFGVLLFEMLSGRRLFEGETVSETLAAVLLRDPDWSALPAGTPDAVRRLLQRCLQRDPRSRLRDIGDARIALEEMLQRPQGTAEDAAGTRSAAPAPLRSAWVPWLVAAAALVALAVVALRPASPPPARYAMHLKLPIPEEQRFSLPWFPALAISPDGRRLVFFGRGPENDPVLYVRAIDQPVAVALPGTEAAENPIFSPDGEWIGFAQGGKLKKIAVGGGSAVTLCEVKLLRGASWGDDGAIVFAPGRTTGLMRVSEAGGAPETLTTVAFDESASINPSHRWPAVLPGGRVVLFTAADNDSDYDTSRIVALTLADRKQKTIVEGGTFPRYVPTGFLTFFRGGTMFAARFDPGKLELTGPAVPVLEGVAIAPFYGSAQAAFSAHGTLVWLEHLAGSSGERTLVWLDREGTESPATARSGPFGWFDLAPDGGRVALEIAQDRLSSVWILELERDTLSRLTFQETHARQPVWSPDGEWIAFDSVLASSSRNLYRKRADGTGRAEFLTRGPLHRAAHSWSPDGRTIAFHEREGETHVTNGDLLLLRLGAEHEVEPLLESPFDEDEPMFSPDGRWIAYISDESGEHEVYVLPVAGRGGRTKISTDGGLAPRWSRDGTELFYFTEDRELMAVRLSAAGGALRVELPRRLFELTGEYDLPYAVGPDGRFLIVRELGQAGASLPEPSVIVGWFDELERRVPRGSP